MSAWKRDEDRRLAELAARLSSRQIAEVIGRSADSVKYRAKRLRISLAKVGDHSPATKYSDLTIERARRLHDAGFGPRWIARRLCVNENTLRSALYYRQRLQPALAPGCGDGVGS